MLGTHLFNRNTDKAIKRHNALVEAANRIKEPEDEDISYLLKPSGKPLHITLPLAFRKES